MSENNFTRDFKFVNVNFVMKRQESYQVYNCLSKHNFAHAFKFVNPQLCHEETRIISSVQLSEKK